MKTLLFSKSVLAFAVRNPLGTFLAALLIAVWTIPHSTLPQLLAQKFQDRIALLPSLAVDLHPTQTFRDRFSTNKTVLYIEPKKDVRHALPLLLHMAQILPPEWRFLFIGAEELVQTMKVSMRIQRLQQIGKLRLELVESWTDSWSRKDRDRVEDENEVRSRLLTDLKFYDEMLPGVEWLMIFKSNSIMCANANQTVNDFLEYSFVGAPWRTSDSFGGNGGLSLRRLSVVREVLQFQKREENSRPEDEWFAGRIGVLPNANNAGPEISMTFSVESIWYDRPLGYHIPPDIGPGRHEFVWSDEERRNQIFEYCPEIKMVMPMRLEVEKCPRIV